MPARRGKALRLIARIFTIIWIAFWGFFAAVSGAEAGFSGLLCNLPNAIPWLAPIAALIIAWKKPGIGGMLFFIFAVFTVILFDTWEETLNFALISGPIFLSSLLFLIQASLELRRSQEPESSAE